MIFFTGRKFSTRLVCNRLIPALLAVLLAATVFIPPPAFALEEPEVTAGAAILVDVTTQQMLFSLNENERVYPASLTKIMTVLLAVEAIDSQRVSPDDYVTASENITYDLIPDGSTAEIKVGETMTLRSLLYCAMVQSANEACNIIAEYIGGSITNFIVMMNNRAVELGCTGTRFTNTHGIPDTGHYTTASDMAKIGVEATKHSLFMEICGTQRVELPSTNMTAIPRVYQNTNALLGDNAYYHGFRYEYARGMKTGHTNDAGYCLVSTIIREDKNLLAVVMGCPAATRQDGTLHVNSFSDSIALYEWAHNNWSYKDILRASTVIAEVAIEMGNGADRVSVRPESSISALLPNDIDLGSFERDVTIYSEVERRTLVAPINAGEILGEITIRQGDTVYGTANLVAASSIDLSKMYYIRTEISKTLGSKSVKTIAFVLFILLLLYIALVVQYKVRRIRYRRSLAKARRERDILRRQAVPPTPPAAQMRFREQDAFLGPDTQSEDDDDDFEQFDNVYDDEDYDDEDDYED